MDEEEQTRTVRGEITIPVDLPTQGPVEVIVQIEDISRADAPSEVIGEQRQHVESLRGGAALPFAVEIPSRLIDPRRSYSVRVHVNVTGSDDVELGDFVSTQTYPVLTRGAGDRVRIRLQRV